MPNEIAKSTDLTTTEGDPTSRAAVTVLREEVIIRLRLGRKVELETAVRAGARSPLGIAISTVLLVLSGGAVAVIAKLIIGTPTWVACCGFLVPLAANGLLRLLSGRGWRRRRDG